MKDGRRKEWKAIKEEYRGEGEGTEESELKIQRQIKKRDN